MIDPATSPIVTKILTVTVLCIMRIWTSFSYALQSTRASKENCLFKGDFRLKDKWHIFGTTVDPITGTHAVKIVLALIFAGVYMKASAAGPQTAEIFQQTVSAPGTSGAVQVLKDVVNCEHFQTIWAFFGAYDADFFKYAFLSSVYSLDRMKMLTKQGVAGKQTKMLRDFYQEITKQSAVTASHRATAAHAAAKRGVPNKIKSLVSSHRLLPRWTNVLPKWTTVQGSLPPTVSDWISSLVNLLPSDNAQPDDTDNAAVNLLHSVNALPDTAMRADNAETVTGRLTQTLMRAAGGQGRAYSPFHLMNADLMFKEVICAAEEAAQGVPSKCDDSISNAHYHMDEVINAQFDSTRWILSSAARLVFCQLKGYFSECLEFKPEQVEAYKFTCMVACVLDKLSQKQSESSRSSQSKQSKEKSPVALKRPAQATTGADADADAKHRKISMV